MPSRHSAQPLAVMALVLVGCVTGFVHTPASRSWSSNGNSPSSPGAGRSSLHSAATALDLKPAVDIYVKFPEQAPVPPATLGLTEGLYNSGRVELSVTGKAPNSVDPFALVRNELTPFSDNIKDLVSTDNPVLSNAAKHFFEKRHGKRFRPTIVMLVAKALATLGMDAQQYEKEGQLAQITEMIHVASLIHDDVLDEAETRRGDLAIHKLYNNKVAVLAGDFLLARASVQLARLGNVHVVEIMANALDCLIQGEIMQAKSSEQDLLDLSYYLRKSYYKTASLICNSCRSAAILAGHAYNSVVAEACGQYGHHLGLAFQIVDDILDFTQTSGNLGKPAMADMSLGIATAPILYAAEERPELKPLIKRRFKKDGDIDKTVRYVMTTQGVERSYALALFHAQRAVDALSVLPPSEARDGLIQLAHMSLTRKA